MIFDKVRGRGCVSWAAESTHGDNAVGYKWTEQLNDTYLVMKWLKTTMKKMMKIVHAHSLLF